jgi:hypothetical protein
MTMTKTRKFFLIFIASLLVILAIFIYWKFYFTYSEGSRAGLLQKFSYKGNIFKTYEGELILSSIESNRNAAIASEKFFFSVSDKPLAGHLMKLEGMNVTLHYREKHGVLFWRGETAYIVDSVTVR